MRDRFGFGTEFGFIMATAHALVAFIAINIWSAKLNLIEWAFVMSIPAFSTLVFALCCVSLPGLTGDCKLVRPQALSLPFTFSILVMAIVKFTTTTSYAVAAPNRLQNYFLVWANPILLAVSFLLASVWLYFLANRQERQRKGPIDGSRVG